MPLSFPFPAFFFFIYRQRKRIKNEELEEELAEIEEKRIGRDRKAEKIILIIRIVKRRITKRGRIKNCRFRRRKRRKR